METRILLADNQLTVREGVRLLLDREQDFRVIGGVSNGEEALTRIERDKPDIALLDLALPRLCGLSVIRKLRGRSTTRCAILTLEDSRPKVQEALRIGAAGYMLKSDSPSNLVEAVRVMAAGNYYFSPEISRHVVDAATNPDSGASTELDRLTSREREVLQLVAEGHTTKEIAQLLGVSSRTTESHRARLMEKLNIHKVPGLVRLAIREGLVEA